MKTFYAIWDPYSHEHLVKFVKSRPNSSKWKFLDTGESNEFHVFDTIDLAIHAVNCLFKAGEAEDQLEIRELILAYVETGEKFRVDE